ncbi:hypothetical protein [Streptomyces alkaliphilus]|uniref:hypothetical protein n=1 Tax=Streptomyces alkaliphilus TaxID=1472722 RepID=UPI0015FBD106|nr:hypothetical protein [Streptomyces alkaliphilus]
MTTEQPPLPLEGLPDPARERAERRRAMRAAFAESRRAGLAARRRAKLARLGRREPAGEEREAAPRGATDALGYRPGPHDDGTPQTTTRRNQP